MDHEHGAEAVKGPQGFIRKLIGVFVIVFVVVIGFALAYLGKGFEDPWLGPHIKPFGGTLTIVETSAFLAFIIQFIVFIPAYLFQTEKFYDLTGSLTYLTIISYSYSAGLQYDNISSSFRVIPTVASCLVILWALRLGSFLFQRVIQDNGDKRFEEIKPNFVRFLVAWTLQGLWTFLTAFAVIIANSSATGYESFGVVSIIGLIIWILGFFIEVVSDQQKSKWRKDPSNKGKFIEVGLWYFSRHPNVSFHIIYLFYKIVYS